MTKQIEKLLTSSTMSWSRKQLSYWTGLSDRAVRHEVRRLRRSGIPIVSLKDGGYKIAETDEEKRDLLAMYKHRAIDELTTYSKLMKAMQIDGQLAVDDFIRNMGGAG